MTAPLDPPGWPDPKLYPATDEGLARALKALGGTSKAVASTLDSMGIRGAPGKCQSCPVAVYLMVVTGHEAAATALMAQLYDADHSRIARRALPRPVRDFIERFDFGHYPALVDMGVTSHG